MGTPGQPQIIRASTPRGTTLTMQRPKTPVTPGQTVRVVSNQPGQQPQIINVGAGSALGQKIITASGGQQIITSPVSFSIELGIFLFLIIL